MDVITVKQDARELPTSTPDAISWNMLEARRPFYERHIGPSAADISDMLATLGLGSLDELVAQTIPESIRLHDSLALAHPMSETQMAENLQRLGRQNKIFRSFIGMGYYPCITEPVIERNILANPGWYTQYTPYQAEIAQGRLEALLNFQTMVADLTGLPLANASMLDEATAAGEAMSMCRALADTDKKVFFIAQDLHPQTIEVVAARAAGLNIAYEVGDVDQLDASDPGYFGFLIGYPASDGKLRDISQLSAAAHQHGALVAVTTDLLALTILESPGKLGADIAVGNAQRLGMPMGFGGPHAAFMSTRMEYARKLPGRIVGVSRDAAGRPAYRLAIQTREQHIRREKATSNICTAQVLPAIVASMHGVYHGPDGLRTIASRIHGWTCVLATGLRKLGHQLVHGHFFDTLRIIPSIESMAADIHREAQRRQINLRRYDDDTIGISLDQRTTMDDVHALLHVFSPNRPLPFLLDPVVKAARKALPVDMHRQTPFMTHPVFNQYHNETDMQRYMRYLEAKDLSLTHSMIPLGSCTMKLNSASEMVPFTQPCWADMHPFAPADQSTGYSLLTGQLERFLCEITGFDGVSLQPNAGSQGEYAGLRVIAAFHASNGQSHRNVCLIPVSAHGTNPASAVIAGMEVVTVDCDPQGSIDLTDLHKKSGMYRDRLACLMATYPSTHGVFEETIEEVCRVVHETGGLVYMDGANMNAMVGLCRPADVGADVCHLNLHKTFCIPHGGGGPGMGPIGVVQKLVPFLPGHPTAGIGGANAIGPVSAAPYGSASILTISWAYIAMMGAPGLALATMVAILNANYMTQRLKDHYAIRFRGRQGRVAHEFIIDCRPFEASAGIKVEDIAKRLMDYGFHAPTVSWPEPGTLMLEPTESESKGELDRFCDALIQIRHEIGNIEQGQWDRRDNPLKNAPHTAEMLAADWPHAYSRQQAAYPVDGLHTRKFWPSVRRIDGAYGDRHLFCACPPPQEAS